MLWKVNVGLHVKFELSWNLFSHALRELCSLASNGLLGALSLKHFVYIAVDRAPQKQSILTRGISKFLQQVCYKSRASLGEEQCSGVVLGNEVTTL